jgi:hypothetical protein
MSLGSAKTNRPPRDAIRDRGRAPLPRAQRPSPAARPCSEARRSVSRGAPIRDTPSPVALRAGARRGRPVLRGPRDDRPADRWGWCSVALVARRYAGSGGSVRSILRARRASSPATRRGHCSRGHQCGKVIRPAGVGRHRASSLAGAIGLIGRRFGCVGTENPTGNLVTRTTDRSTGVSATTATRTRHCAARRRAVASLTGEPASMGRRWARVPPGSVRAEARSPMLRSEISGASHREDSMRSGGTRRVCPGVPLAA